MVIAILMGTWAGGGPVAIVGAILIVAASVAYAIIREFERRAEIRRLQRITEGEM